MEAKIADWKKKEVEEIKRLINEYEVFGVANMENFPALQLQRLKSNLKDSLFIKMSKKRLIKIALDQLKKENFDKVKDEIKGMPALIFTKEDPYKLAKILKKKKSSAPAKAGQMAPNDIYIKAGPTPFTPGPIIGELGQLGIKTEVKEGKVVVKDDKLLVKEGDEINAKQADLLSKLKIEPMQIGLNLILTYKNGEILLKNILDIDEELYINNIKLGSQEGFNLAIAIGFITKDTASYLIKRASIEAESLGALEKLKDLPKKQASEPVKEDKPIKEVKAEEEHKVQEKAEEKKEKVIKDVGKPSAEDLIKEADKIPKTEEEKKETEKKMMKEIEDIAKKVMWGEDIKK